MKRVDCFPYGGEADMLECRLTELADAVDAFVIVEADRTHGGNRPKPYYFREHEDRFAPWADRIVYVEATDMPDSADAWDREHAQREWIAEGLSRLDLGPDDIVMQSDVDEIGTELAVRYVNPRGMVVMHQRFHPFAVDWLHPQPWQGTVAARVRDIGKLAAMRDARLWAPTVIPDAGWHFSWVSDGIEAKNAKINSFCHPEIAPTWEGRLDECWETGLHVDGTPLAPVEVVDGEWPRWITEGNAPAAWFRPRNSTRERPVVEVPPLVAPFVQ